MSSAKFTLIGAYQFFNNAGDDLFKNLTLPSALSKDTLTSNILLKGGEFEVQNADPFFIQNAIAIWSSVYHDTFVRWTDALAIDYAPLENYDRHEHWTDEVDVEGTGSSTSTGTVDTTDTVNASGTSDTTDTINASGTMDQETEHTRSAFDSSTYQPNDKEAIDQDTTNTSTEVIDNDTTATSREVIDTDTTDRTNTTSTSDSDSVHDGRVHGNIGVTTSQQMLMQELDMGYWNIYERITDLFLREFIIPVYE